MLAGLATLGVLTTLTGLAALAAPTAASAAATTAATALTAPAAASAVRPSRGAVRPLRAAATRAAAAGAPARAATDHDKQRRKASAAAAASKAPRIEPWDGEPFAADPAAVAHAAARFEGRDGEPVVVLLSEQHYSFDAAGREVYTQRLVYRLLTAAADESWSTVERSWAPWHQARPEVRARVITPDGVALPLDPAVLTESGEVQDGPDMFGDGRVLRGPLPATGPGVVVEQQVTVRDTAPFFDAGLVEVTDVAASVSVHHARVIVEAPAAAALRWTARLLPQNAPRDEAIAGDPPRRRLTFDYRDLAATDDPETGLAPEQPRTPYLAFSTGRSWGDIAHRYSQIVDDAIRGADMTALIRAAGGTAPSQMDTMNRLLRRLGDIRYTGVELGQGGIVPRSPAETLRRKFGDCKDKAVLLIAALRALDIPAYAALLNSGEDQQDIEEELPGFGGFNHAIVVVPGSPQVWIDPTDPFARAGELPTDDQGRLALIASPTATALIRTPEAAPEENRAEKTREIYLADLGPARAVESDRYWGASERDLRAFYVSEDAETVRESLSEYVRKSYLAKELTSYDHADPRDLAQPFRLRLEVREIKSALTYEKTAAVAILPAALLDQLPDDLTAAGKDEPGRVADFYFGRPFVVETTFRMVPPPGFAPRPLPPSQTLQLGTASLTETFAATPDGVVTATLRLDTGKRRIGAKEFESLRAAVRQVRAAKPILVQFEQVGETDLAAGNVRAAIAEFQREAAAAPKKALPHSRLARALLAGGLGEAARREAERATHLEPRSAAAQRTLAWVLQHDGIGRRFGTGFDRAAAVAAYRKAKSLDAEDETTRADLAILLEHDAQGRRYAADADLAGAITEYQGLRDQLKTHAYDDNLLAALVHAGRFAEAVTLASELDDTPARDAQRLVALAATAGADAALGDAERRIGDPGARVGALDTAARELVALRRYGEAATLLARAARLSPNSAAYLVRADALRLARRHQEAPRPAATRTGAADPAADASDASGATNASGASSAGAPADAAATTDAAETIETAGRQPGGADAGSANASRAGAAARRFLLATLADPPATDRMVAALSAGLTQAMSPAAQRELAASFGASPLSAQHDALLAADVRQDLAAAAWHTAISGDDAAGYRVQITARAGAAVARTALFLVPDHGEYRVAALGDAPYTLGLEALRRLAAHDEAGARRWLDWAVGELRRPAATLRNPPPGAAGAPGIAGIALSGRGSGLSGIGGKTGKGAASAKRPAPLAAPSPPGAPTALLAQIGAMAEAAATSAAPAADDAFATSAASERAPGAGARDAADAGDPAGALPAIPMLAVWSTRPEGCGSDDTAAPGLTGAAPWAACEPAAAPATTAATAATPSDAGCAAATLAAGGAAALTPAPGQALLARLEGCRDGAAADTARRTAFEVALAQAQSGLGRFQDLLDASGRLAAAHPGAQRAFAFQARALAGLGRLANLEELAQRWLRSHPEDPLALRLAARTAAHRGDLTAAALYLRHLVAGGQETAGDLNDLAWLALVRGQPDDQAFADAQQAVELSRFADPAALHTLAALCVERGRAAEGYRVAIEAIEVRPGQPPGARGAPEAADWYIFGQLAETYGMPDEARRLYARVTRPPGEDADPLSTFRLAQARLAALGTVKQAEAAHGNRGGGGR